MQKKHSNAGGQAAALLRTLGLNAEWDHGRPSPIDGSPMPKIADTDAAAQLLATSMQQACVNLRSGRPGQLPAPNLFPGYRLGIVPVRFLLESLVRSL